MKGREVLKVCNTIINNYFGSLEYLASQEKIILPGQVGSNL